VFSPGSVRDISGELRLRLYLIEAGLLVTVVWFVRSCDYLWRTCRGTLFQQIFLAIAFLLVAVAVLLLPLCFGRIQMIPRNFDRVTLLRDKDQPALTGILVFSDAESYFIFTAERKLTEVLHRTVREIQYESREPLARLANQ
jgi:hypothetical protein